MGTNSTRRRGLLKVYGHPRSGMNWLLALLEQALEGHVSLVETITGHWSHRVGVTAPDRWLRGGHHFYNDQQNGPRVYLFRDGRDVALSLWHTKEFQDASWHKLSFAEFLRKPLDWQATPKQRCRYTDEALTIAEHWKAHLFSWQNAPGTCFVRYEDLLRHTESEVTRIVAFVGRRPLPGVGNVTGVGPSPSGDYRAAKWRGVFTDDDLDYFFKFVPRDFWGLWEDTDD